MREYLLKNEFFRHVYVTVNTAGAWFDTAEDTLQKKKRNNV